MAVAAPDTNIASEAAVAEEFIVLRKRSISVPLTILAPLIFLDGFFIIESSSSRHTSCLSCCYTFLESFLSLTAGGAPVIGKRSGLTFQKKMQTPAYLLCFQLILIKHLCILHIISLSLQYLSFLLVFFFLRGKIPVVLSPAGIKCRNPALRAAPVQLQCISVLVTGGLKAQPPW